MSNYLGFEPTDNSDYYFVSYNNEDADRVGLIAKALLESGVPLWYDYGIEYGEKWASQINERLSKAKAMLLFFTKGILQKKDSYVQKEFRIARLFRKKVIVLMMDKIRDEDIPISKADWWVDIIVNQSINLYELSDEGAILKEIRRALGLPDMQIPAVWQRLQEEIQKQISPGESRIRTINQEITKGGTGAETDDSANLSPVIDAQEALDKGHRCEEKKEYEEAARWYRIAAEQGHATAQRNLGSIYYVGKGVEKDYTEAVKWYHKAAAQGDVVAQFILGVCYEYGDGVEKDTAEAVKWYRKAAEQGDATSQRFLGNIYYIGGGVEKDFTEAVKWYRKAAEQGDADAQFSLGACYASGQGIEKNTAEAVKWYRKAAEQGVANAQYILGMCYEKGSGVEKDTAEAVKWYRKAAEQGKKEAKAALARLGIQ